MLNFIVFLILLEISILGHFSWLAWLVWFLVSYISYFKRTKSLKKIIFGLLFLVWVIIVSHLYLPKQSFKAVDLSKLRINLHFVLVWLSVLYYLSLKIIEGSFFRLKALNRKMKISWAVFKNFLSLSIFYISAIFLFSGRLYYWWANSLAAFGFFVFWLLIFAKKGFNKVDKMIIGLLFLEMFLVIQFFSLIPEIKSLVFSLMALFFI